MMQYSLICESICVYQAVLRDVGKTLQLQVMENHSRGM